MSECGCVNQAGLADQYRTFGEGRTLVTHMKIDDGPINLMALRKEQTTYGLLQSNLQ